MDDRMISVDRDYLNALLRRAELRAPNSTQDETSVVIPKPVHDSLLKESKDYHSLRQALLHAGVSLEELDTLTRGAEQSPSRHSLGQVDLTHEGNLFEKETRRAKRLSSADDENSYWGDNGQENATFRPKNVPSQRKEPPAARTLFLSNLPEAATLKDITSLIKGGRLIEIWLGKNERTASVTFAEGAAEFLAYSKRNDIYIGSKRINVGWSERQFVVPSHLRYKLANGHSRNLVIRGASGRVTEEQVREDMEHIHNLVIIATVWKAQDVYISTNSVNNATFARNCMLSRLRYKGLRIEWYPDECAEEIPEPTLKPAQLNRQTSGVSDKPKNSVPNRFDLLSLDDGSATADSSDSDTEEQDKTPGIFPFTRTAEKGAVTA